jgi:hypothetical protein
MLFGWNLKSLAVIWITFCLSPAVTGFCRCVHETTRNVRPSAAAKNIFFITPPARWMIEPCFSYKRKARRIMFKGNAKNRHIETEAKSHKPQQVLCSWFFLREWLEYVFGPIALLVYRRICA